MNESEYTSLYYSTRKNAARRNIEFALTEAEFMSMVKKSKGRCQVTGIAFSFHGWDGSGSRRPYAPSIDRISSDGIYRSGNVRLVCIAANLAMNTWGEKVLVTLAKAICGDETARQSSEDIPDQAEINKTISNINPSVGKYLSRVEAAQYLTEKGLRTSNTTLQKWVTVGGGPEYRRFGKRAVYQSCDLDAWAAQKLSPLRRSSSLTQ